MLSRRRVGVDVPLRAGKCHCACTMQNANLQKAKELPVANSKRLLMFWREELLLVLVA